MKILLFWYSLNQFSQCRSKFSLSILKEKIIGRRENYGDLLSKYIFERLSGQKTIWFNPSVQNSQENKINYLGAGSILKYANVDSVIWGSGIISKSHPISRCDLRAIRGPETRKRLLELGYECPKVYGDPAILLPLLYYPKVKKRIDIGIIPHYSNYTEAVRKFKAFPNIRVIQLLTNNIEKTTSEILSCKKILSSSLHGLIVAHSYNIPAVRIEFSGKLYGDGVKFSDYQQSVGLEDSEGEFITEVIDLIQLNNIFLKKENLPDQEILEKLRKGLLESFPVPLNEKCII